MSDERDGLFNEGFDLFGEKEEGEGAHGGSACARGDIFLHEERM